MAKLKPNFYFRVWLRFTVWMLRHDKFSYAYLWDRSEVEGNREFRARLKGYRQSWPWVDANLIYLCEELARGDEC